MAGRWRLLDLSYASVFQNLALEEALFRSRTSGSHPTIRIWVDPRAVVVGRFQAVSEEVDVSLCQQNNIQIGRRFTGGGAVFHDEGNLNLTVVTPRQRGISLAEFYKPNCAVISNLLDRLGAKSSYVPPNSIEILGRKVSGSAGALGREFAFWHASILISTNEQMLNDVLEPSRAGGATKFIRSRWRPVVTLERALGTHLDIEDMKRRLIDSCKTCFRVELENGELSAEEVRLMGSLYDRKYSSGKWNLRGFGT
jgi:lipoate-protein ligase A